jgi:hypothetical protein
MSKINVNTWEPEGSGTTITAGASGDTLAISADSVTGLNVGSDAAGDVLYNDGTDYTRLAKPGTPADEVLTFATGASIPSWVAASAGGFNSCQFFDATGTWTKPADITKVIVIVTGGGGGAGGGDNNGRAGGGAATAIRTITSGLGSTEAIGIGAGGTAGGTGGGGSAGGTGGTTSFGSHCTAGGGGGGGAAFGTGSASTSGLVSGIDFAMAGGGGQSYVGGGGSFWGPGGWALTAYNYGTSAASWGGSGSAVGKQGCVWVLEFK